MSGQAFLPQSLALWCAGSPARLSIVRSTGIAIVSCIATQFCASNPWCPSQGKRAPHTDCPRMPGQFSVELKRRHASLRPTSSPPRSPTLARRPRPFRLVAPDRRTALKRSASRRAFPRRPLAIRRDEKAAIQKRDGRTHEILRAVTMVGTSRIVLFRLVRGATLKAVGA
jgi:hypothetical protein